MLQNKIKTEREKVVELTGLLNAQQNENKNLSQKLIEQKAELESLQERFKTEFKNIANEILEDKSKRFTEQNKTNLDEILKPFSEKIKDFENEKLTEDQRKILEDKDRAAGWLKLWQATAAAKYNFIIIRKYKSCSM